MLKHILPKSLNTSLSLSLPPPLSSLYSLTLFLTEVERFIEMNTEKISENKYLCPLSGKKFKGPEFVRKHIFNKHLDKVEAVKQEVTPLQLSLWK